MRYQKNSKSRAGFTLIELTVVLIELEILISGTVSKVSMVREAKLLRAILDAERYNLAVRTFKAKHNNAVPGDMSNAYSFFRATCSTGGATNCNGNGSGLVDYAADATNEINKAWVHLNKSKILDFMPSIDTLTSSGSGVMLGSVMLGKQAPSSKITGAGLTIKGPATATTQMFGPNANAVMFGKGETTSAASGNIRAYDPSASTTNCLDAAGGNYTVLNATTFCMIGSANDENIGAIKYFGIAANEGSSPFVGTFVGNHGASTAADFTGFNNFWVHTLPTQAPITASCNIRVKGNGNGTAAANASSIKTCSYSAIVSYVDVYCYIGNLIVHQTGNLVNGKPTYFVDYNTGRNPYGNQAWEVYSWYCNNAGVAVLQVSSQMEARYDYSTSRAITGIRQLILLLFALSGIAPCLQV